MINPSLFLHKPSMHAKSWTPKQYLPLYFCFPGVVWDDPKELTEQCISEYSESMNWLLHNSNTGLKCTYSIKSNHLELEENNAISRSNSCKRIDHFSKTSLS